MTLGLLAQYVMNGAMLGMMYALVAVGFTLFFGVLDVIQFSHGDVLAAGAFVALAVWTVLDAAGISAPAVQLVLIALASGTTIALLGALVGRWLVLPLRLAPAINVLLVTLMMGTVVREAIRLLYPGGSQPQRFPALLPTSAVELGAFTLRADNAILLLGGRLGARCIRRGHERAVLQRSLLRDGVVARRDRLRVRGGGRTRKSIRRGPRRGFLRRAADRGGGRPPR